MNEMILHNFTFWLSLATIVLFQLKEVEGGAFRRVARYPGVEQAQQSVQPLAGIEGDRGTYKLNQYSAEAATTYCNSKETGHPHYVELLYKDVPLDFFCASDPLNSNDIKEVSHCHGKMSGITQIIIKVNQHNNDDKSCRLVLFDVPTIQIDISKTAQGITSKQFNCEGELTTANMLYYMYFC